MTLKVSIEVSGKTIELTEEEARELFAKLDGMFGPKNTYYPVSQPNIHVWQNLWPNQKTSYQPFWNKTPEITYKVRESANHG